MKEPQKPRPANTTTHSNHPHHPVAPWGYVERGDSMSDNNDLITRAMAALTEPIQFGDKELIRELVEEVQLMQPVVKAADDWANGLYKCEEELANAVADYNNWKAST